MEISAALSRNGGAAPPLADAVESATTSAADLSAAVCRSWERSSHAGWAGAPRRRPFTRVARTRVLRVMRAHGLPPRASGRREDPRREGHHPV